MADEFIDPTVGVPAAPRPKDTGDFVDPTVFTQSLTASPPGHVPQSHRNIVDSREKGATYLQNLKASLAPNVKDQIKHYSQSMGIPEDRFGVMGGNIVYADQDGTYHRVVPSVAGGQGVLDTAVRANNWIASKVGPTLPEVAGGTAGVLTTPAGPVASTAAATTVAGATDVARQAVSNWLLNKSIGDIDWANAGGHAAMAGVGQGGGLLVNRAFSRNPLGIGAHDRLNALDPARQREIADLLAEARRRNIDLSAGQATNLRSLLVEERRLGRYDETADRMYDFARNQRETQVPRAIRQEIQGISPQRGEEAIQSFRSGAEAVETAARDARRAASQTLYDEAFAANQSVGSREIDRIVETPAGKAAFKQAVEKMQNDRTNVGIPDEELTEAMRFAADLGKMERVKGGVSSGLKLRTWDYVKRSLGDIEQEHLRAGRMDDARIIGNLRRDLTRQLDRLDATASTGPNSVRPDGGAYRRARQAYSEGAEALEEIQEGGVGFINNMQGMDRQGIVNRIFSAQNITAEGVRRARTQFELAGRLDDWNAGLSSFLSDKLDNAMKVNASGSRGNVPGKFYAEVWGDERQRDIVIAAMGPARVQGFERFMQVLNAASRSLPEGSPTATDLAASGGAQTLSRGAQVIGKLASPSTYIKAGDEIAKGIDALRTPGARRQLAEALLSGDYDRQLQRLRMLPVDGQRAINAMGQILVETWIGASGARTPNDFDAPAMQPRYQK